MQKCLRPIMKEGRSFRYIDGTLWVKGPSPCLTSQPQVAIYQESANAGWWKKKAYSVSLSMRRGAKDLYRNREACFGGGQS